MLKYFTLVMNFLGLLGTFYAFLHGATLYITVFLSALFALGGIIAWNQDERATHLRSILCSALASLLDRVGAEALPAVVQIARRPGMQSEVIRVLAQMLRVKPDPTERAWIYTMLGQIGGRRSKKELDEGLKDESEFVRKVVQDTLDA